MKRVAPILVAFILGGLAGYYFGYDVGFERAIGIPSLNLSYENDQFGISFEYPAGYFTHTVDLSTGQRKQYAIILAEDTPQNRALFAGEIPGTDGPPTITIFLFQNDLDNYSTREFVEGNSFSNFKLSDGTLTDVALGGEPGVSYRATGLYENENVVVARPKYVYMFTAFFNSPEDQIVADFKQILQTVEFK